MRVKPGGIERAAASRIAARDRRIAGGVCRWFQAEARPLPWREARKGKCGAVRDPYLSLVSEFMLQQTQVSRVLEKWGRLLGDSRRSSPWPRPRSAR